jgi:hypothetical protein
VDRLGSNSTIPAPDSRRLIPEKGGSRDAGRLDCRGRIVARTNAYLVAGLMSLRGSPD